MPNLLDKKREVLQTIEEMAQNAKYHGCPFLGFLLTGIGELKFIPYGDPIEYRKCGFYSDERDRCFFSSGEACWKKCSCYVWFYSPETKKSFEQVKIFPNKLHPENQTAWEGITVSTWLEVCEQIEASR